MPASNGAACPDDDRGRQSAPVDPVLPTAAAQEVAALAAADDFVAAAALTALVAGLPLEAELDRELRRAADPATVIPPPALPELTKRPSTGIACCGVACGEAR